MRRRLTVATVGVVALALVLSGLFTLLLVRRAAREETRRELVAQATDLAGQVDEVDKLVALGRVTRVLQLEGVARVDFGPRGAIRGPLPPGIEAADLDVEALRRGSVTSGVQGSVAFAAAPAVARPNQRANRGAPALTAVVLTRHVGSGLRSGGSWFALAAVFSLAVAAAVADRVGRRIVAPLRSAEEATRQIAAGDLEARVAPGPGADDEVASLSRSINAMADNLGRARGLERQFLLAVSHDLRTPLTSIRGFAEAISDGAATDHRRAASVIATESRRLERLVGDLLELANLESRRFSLDLRTVDVAEVVSETVDGFRPAADELGIAVVADVAPAGTAMARADPDRLAQVVANLVENAMKFASTTIAVTVSGRTAGRTGLVEIVVSDDGPGLAAADLPHVFERLYQSGRTPARAAGPGSGLGLAIVAELVQALGGRVRAESPGPGGARLVVELPAVPD